MECKDTMKWSSLEKDDLIQMLTQRDAHIKQLTNVIKRRDNDCTKRELKPCRPFDFNRFKKRHVAFKMLYFGWDYHGFASQEDEMNTIEEHLFNALLKTKMIESRQTSNYHRCGRTDKGVSAFSQVISLDVRTNMPDGLGVFQGPAYTGSNKTLEKDKISEIPYISLLNRVLPDNIKIISWAPVEQTFSARFSCIQRTYKYYFPSGGLDLEKMQEAANMLEGEHDFRNLCKMDIGGGVTTFIRKISKVTLNIIEKHSKPGYSLCEMIIEGSGYLWHQIRCIMGVLFLVGKGNEQPQIIRQLLDIEGNPCKPQYCMAEDFPLVLFKCEFENLEWQHDRDSLEILLAKLQEQWTQAAIKATTIKQMLDGIEELPVLPKLDVMQQDCKLIMGAKSKVYKPLFERPKCESLEDRLKRVKRRKLDIDVSLPNCNK